MGAGGAVVADSDPHRELSEAFDKAAGPVAAIGGRVDRPARRVARLNGLPRRALRYGARPDPGMGVFETVLLEHGRPVALERHLDRLAASVGELYGATLPPTLVAGAHAAAAESATAERSRMRVLVDSDGSVRISVSTASTPLTGPRGAVVLVPFALPGGLGAHKWRDRRLLEALRASGVGAVPLLVDTDGRVLEAAYANVWIVEGDELITPPADGRILPGTTRAALLASEPGAREETFDLARLAGADSVFLTSSISGRHPARLDRPASALGSSALVLVPRVASL
jgi:para-aminobenzoate synthetase/4-amino-4-deoxychorismate lyase